MPLRVRLTITLLATVLVPLVIVGMFVPVFVRRQLDARAQDRLNDAQSSVDALLDRSFDPLYVVAHDLADRPEALAASLGRRDAVAPLVADFGRRGYSDWLAVVDPAGRVLAKAGETGAFLPGASPPSIDSEAVQAAAVQGESHGGWSLRYTQPILEQGTGRPMLYVVAGTWLDNRLVSRMHVPGSPDITFAVEGRSTATSLERPQTAFALAQAIGPKGPEGLMLASGTALAEGPTVLTSVPRGTIAAQAARARLPLLALAVVFALLAAGIGWVLARVATRPLDELSQAALKVASGQLDTHIAVRSKDEVGRLALAFNTMTDELRTYVAALQSSRDELTRSLTRLGTTLSSTHDLHKMLSVILETALITMRAEAGSLMLMSLNRDEVYLKVGLGLEGRLSSEPARMRVGEGVAGRVAETGEAVHGPVGTEPGQLPLAPGEPRADNVISVPLISQGRVIGVLNLYDRVDADAFDDADLTTIRSFANQATVAIDNVMLHEEAKRLSITDGLTGLWNYRFFHMKLNDEIERATRFHRPLALLMLDLDHFKKVNDAHGHQCGDSVLVELATRVKGEIREIDLFARYGGEEFVVILPETDLEGARQAAAKIREIVRSRPIDTGADLHVAVTVSIGVAVYPLHGTSGRTLVRSADAALYEAKQAGRDRYVVARALEAGEVGGDAGTPAPEPPVDDPAQRVLASAAESVTDPQLEMPGRLPGAPTPPAPAAPAPAAPAPPPPVAEPVAPATATAAVSSVSAVVHRSERTARYPQRSSVRRSALSSRRTDGRRRGQH